MGIINNGSVAIEALVWCGRVGAVYWWHAGFGQIAALLVTVCLVSRCQCRFRWLSGIACSRCVFFFVLFTECYLLNFIIECWR